MRRALAPVVPPALRDVLEEDVAAPGAERFTLLLLTIAADGWPQLAMLSVGEVVATADTRLRVALWPRSSAARNLARRRRAVLHAVVAPTSYALRLEVEPAGTVTQPDGRSLAVFAAAVASATAEEAPYAELEHGVGFRLRDPAAGHARWRAVRAALREGGA